MSKSKNYFNFFVYISLFFVLILLYQNNYLHFPQVKSGLWLFISLLSMFAGFLVNANAWRCLLKAHDIEISYANAIASTGLSIFGKYIPGKFWVVIGQAAYIAKKNGQSIYKLSGISLIGQIIVILTGIILGSFVLWRDLNQLFIIAFVCACVLLLIFLSPLAKLISEEFSRFKRIKQALNLMGPHLVKVLPWYILLWVFWGVGFYGLAASLSDMATWRLIPSFALAGAIGVIAFFVPGGIGVREGTLSFFLIKNGYSPEFVATIAVGSRIWFLTGELFIFISGMILDRRSKGGSCLS